MIWSDDELKNHMKKFEVILDNANKVGIKIEVCKQLLCRALDEYSKNDKVKVQKLLIELKYELAKAVEDKWGTENGGLSFVINSIKKYFRFVFPMYGVWVTTYAILWLVVAGCLLFYGPFNSSDDRQFDWMAQTIKAITEGHTAYKIPHWAPLFGAIGTSVQIIFGVAYDVKYYGYVRTSRRLWYLSLPFVGLVFGLFAYILYKIGLISVGASPTPDTTIDSQQYLPMLICFLAGYSTDWFKDRLKKLTS